VSGVLAKNVQHFIAVFVRGSESATWRPAEFSVSSFGR